MADDARERIEDWRRDYNETRPHMALGGLTPNAFAQQTYPARKVAQAVDHIRGQVHSHHSINIPTGPLNRGGSPVFREPWEAQAFAMILALYEQGLFTWTEWAAALSDAIKQAQVSGDCDDGSTYFQQWLSAIEQLVRDKGIANEQALVARRDARDRAAHATLHGQPILIENDPF